MLLRSFAVFTPMITEIQSGVRVGAVVWLLAMHMLYGALKRIRAVANKCRSRIF